jgi:hypothetical protein
LPGGIPQLAIAAEDTSHTYSRSLFSDWIDADHDCQNTRAEVLISESAAPVTFTTSRDCTVATGRWVSPWSGVVVTQASQVQIDHEVPLAEVWRSGAWAWTPAQRLAYANDLSFADHLNALPNSENTAKSDHDPTSWKPSLTTSWCRYARDWTTIKATYHLTADPTEWDAALTMAKTCRHQPANKQVTRRWDAERSWKSGIRRDSPPPHGDFVPGGEGGAVGSFHIRLDVDQSP